MGTRIKSYKLPHSCGNRPQEIVSSFNTHTFEDKTSPREIVCVLSTNIAVKYHNKVVIITILDNIQISTLQLKFRAPLKSAPAKSQNRSQMVLLPTNNVALQG